MVCFQGLLNLPGCNMKGQAVPSEFTLGQELRPLNRWRTILK